MLGYQMDEVAASLKMSLSFKLDICIFPNIRTQYLQPVVVPQFKEQKAIATSSVQMMINRTFQRFD